MRRHYRPEPTGSVVGAMLQPPTDDPLTFSVVLPTYRRPDLIGDALDALGSLDPAADEILVVVRDDDEETHAHLRSRPAGPPLRIVPPERPGLGAAYAAGFAAARHEVVAFTDDDARVRPDHLARLAVHYRSDPAVGAVGGRDDLVNLDLTPPSRSVPVGRVLPTGRMVGNHHCGSGPPRDVDFLKGVTLSVRRSAVSDRPFEDRLIGPAVPPAVEISCPLAVRAAGGRVVYDPNIVVTHLTAPRPDVQRLEWDAVLARQHSFNHALVFGQYLPPGRYRRWLAWSVLVGSGPGPGLAWTVRAGLTGRRAGALTRLRASMGGLRAGHRAAGLEPRAPARRRPGAAPR